MILGAMTAMLLLAASPAFAHSANVQSSLAVFGDQTAVQAQVACVGCVQEAFQGQIAWQSQAIYNAGWGALNYQSAGAYFGDQNLAQVQILSVASQQSAFQGQAALQQQAIWNY